MARIWTDEQKQKQREAIKRWSPWTSSTGPRTQAGKHRSSQNSLKHARRCAGARRLDVYFAWHKRFIRAAQAYNNVIFTEARKDPNFANELLSGQSSIPFIPPPFPTKFGLKRVHSPPTTE